MKDKSHKSHKNHKMPEKLAPWISCTACGVLLGLTQTAGFPGVLTPSLLLGTAFFFLVKARRFSEFLRSSLLFLGTYYFTQNSFLITFYPNIPVSKPLAVTAATAAAVIMTLWALLLMMIPLAFGYFFKNMILRSAALPFLFVLGEHIQEHSPPFAFPWSRLEHSLLGHPTLLQSSKYLGGSFPAFVIAATASLAALALAKRHDRKTSASALITAAALFCANAAWGTVIEHTFDKDAGESIDCMIIQTSVEGNDKDYLSPEDISVRIAQLINENIRPETKLVLMPETAIPTHYQENSSTFTRFSGIAKTTGASIAVGCFTENGDDVYNSVMIFEPDGTVSPCYDKTVLVPFGEYAPIFKKIFGGGEISPAKDSAPIDTPLGKLGVMICLESIYSDISNSQTSNGAQLILIPTNDSWFGNSFGRDIHFRHSVMRAIESGKYVVRAGNCGISAFISPLGEIITAEYSKNEAVLHSKVRLRTQPTPYSLHGDLIMIPSIAVFLWGAALATYRLIDRRKKFKIKKSKKTAE